MTAISLVSSVAPVCRGSLKAIVMLYTPPPTGVGVIVATGPVVSTVNVPFGKIYAPLSPVPLLSCYAYPRDELLPSRLFWQRQM